MKEVANQGVTVVVGAQCLSSVRTGTPPTPSPPSECVLPPHQRGGGYTLARAVRGWGSIFCKTPDIEFASLQNNLSTVSRKVLVKKSVNFCQHGKISLDGYRRRYKVAESSLNRAETILKPRNLVGLALRTSKAKLRDLYTVIKRWKLLKVSLVFWLALHVYER